MVVDRWCWLWVTTTPSPMAALDESFKRPGSIPFKWELQPGVPKQPSAAAGGGSGRGTSSSPAAAAASLLLPPRLALIPPAHDAGSSSLASSSPALSRRRSMSARFTASLVLPFVTRPRRGRSKQDDEADMAFSVLHGDKIM